MDIELAEAIVAACEQQGVQAAVKEDYSASWMRGRKTVGVMILAGDLAHVLTAIIANPHYFTKGGLPKFDLKNTLLVSTFRINLVLY